MEIFFFYLLTSIAFYPFVYFLRSILNQIITNSHIQSYTISMYIISLLKDISFTLLFIFHTSSPYKQILYEWRRIYYYFCKKSICSQYLYNVELQLQIQIHFLYCIYDLLLLLLLHLLSVTVVDFEISYLLTMFL